MHIAPSRAGDLQRRLSGIRRAMAGYPGFPRTQNAIAYCVFESDAAPQSFNRIIRGHRSASREFLENLHAALRLNEIGVAFHAELWEPGFPLEKLESLIREKRRRNINEALIPRLIGRSPLFGFERSRALVFSHIKDKRSIIEDLIPRTAFQEEETVRVWVNPPIDGFMKFVVLEGGEAIGLDSYFNLSSRRFESQQKCVLPTPFRALANPPNALFIAVIQAERFEARWPSDHEGKRINEAQFAELLSSLPYEQPIWAHRVFVVGGDR